MKSFIKNNLLLLTLLFFIISNSSCKNKLKEKSENIEVYSKTQQHMFDLLDNYKLEYSATNRKDLKENIKNKYLEKFYYFLSDTLRLYIDSMNVTVDTVFQEGWLVTTQFHSRDIEFKYGMEFKDSMDSKNDSLYQWMRNLKPKSNIVLDFALFGSVQLYYPDENPKSIIKLFACPLKK